ncbi:MAG: WYL domain-containing protein [Pseudomonadota bacterium]
MSIPTRPTRWSQEQRLEFIDFRLYWEGRINRSDLISFFGISVPQASLDLAKYIQTAPENINYDKKQKVYLSTPNFKPAFITPNAYDYLNGLKSVLSGFIQKESLFSGWHPPVDSVSTPYRAISAHVLKTVLDAIRYQHTLTIEYQSLTEANPVTRDISPHAIACDGQRWHIRAYCHLRQQFRDFLLARILNLDIQGSSTINAANDNDWATILTLELAPNPALSSSQKQVIARDYAMENERVNVPTRLALLRYTLKHLGLWEANAALNAQKFTEKDILSNPHEHPIILLNREALAPYF